MYAIFRLDQRSLVRLHGEGTAALLKKLLCGHVRALKPGCVLQSPMLNLQGGTMDNVLVCADAPDNCWMIVHECSREKDLRHIRKQAGSAIVVEDKSADVRLYTAVGPEAGTFLQGASAYLCLQSCETDAESWLLAVEEADVPAFETDMAQRGAVLHAQEDLDLLMIENGVPAYGRELDDTINPLEVGLRRCVNLERAGFIGREALVAAGEPRRGVIGLVLSEEGAQRGLNVVHRDKDVGMVTSAAYSPRMKRCIALALVEKPYQDVGRRLMVECGDRLIEAHVSALPFQPEPESEEA